MPRLGLDFGAFGDFWEEGNQGDNVAGQEIEKPNKGMWIHRVRVHTGMGSQSPSSSRSWRPRIWGQNGAELRRDSVRSMPDQSARDWREWNLSPALFIPASDTHVFVGLTRGEDAQQWRISRGDRVSGTVFRSRRVVNVESGGNVSLALDGTNNIETHIGNTLGVTIDVVYNEKPPVPVWVSPTPSHQSTITDVTPDIGVRCDNPSDERPYDYPAAVQIRCYELDTGNIVYDETTNLSGPAGNVSSTLYPTLPALGAGDSYALEARQKDSTGLWSDWTSDDGSVRTFTIAGGPSAPVPQGAYVQGRQIITNPSPYRMNYVDGTGIVWKGTQIQILADDGVTVVRDSANHASGTTVGGVKWMTSGHVGLISNPGANTNGGILEADADWLPSNLGMSTKYKWRARHLNNNNVFGEWSDPVSFFTNSSPNIPSNLTPRNGDKVDTPTLRCEISDPDGDTVTGVQCEVIRADTGAAVGTNPKTMTIAGDNASATFSTSGLGLTAGVDYRWRARATDGSNPNYSTYSNWMDFRQVNIPTVVMLSPPGSGVNLVQDPGAEYDNSASEWWAFDTQNATNTVVRLDNEDDVAFGNACWEITSDGVSNFGMTSGFMNVDRTKPTLVSGWLEYKSGVTNQYRMQVLCYDASSGTVLSGGTLAVPTHYGGVVAGTTVLDNAWKRYGGFFDANAFPVGTARIKIRVQRVVSAGGSGVIRADGFMARNILEPFANVTDTKGNHGYFDGDEDPLFGQPSNYQWQGARGKSTSEGPGYVEEMVPAQGANFVISYTSGGVKTYDRLEIQEWGGESWRGIYTSGDVIGSRTVIPFPTGVFKNHTRYRAKIYASNGTFEGDTGWIVFDVRMLGPKAIGILTADTDIETATANVSFEAPTVTGSNFGGVEIGIQLRPDGAVDIVDRIDKEGVTDYTYQFPPVNAEFAIMVRQVKIDSTSGNRVASRWSAQDLTLETQKWHIKDLEEPTLYHLSFDVYQDEEPTFDYGADSEQLRPWGSSVPVELVSEHRSAEGSVTVRFHRNGWDTQQQLWVIRRLHQRRKGVCIQAYKPHLKFFAAIQTIAETGGDLPWVAVFDIDWRETLYVEDIYRRDSEKVPRGYRADN